MGFVCGNRLVRHSGFARLLVRIEERLSLMPALGQERLGQADSKPGHVRHAPKAEVNSEH